MGPCNYSCTNNSHITISNNWLRTSAVIDMYKARVRRNGYRMFISVYILWRYVLIDSIIVFTLRAILIIRNMLHSSRYSLMCGSIGWTGGPPTPSLENYKNIGFLSNTGWGPLNNHKATKPAFHVGPSLVRHTEGYYLECGDCFSK